MRQFEKEKKKQKYKIIVYIFYIPAVSVFDTGVYLISMMICNT